MNTSIKKLPILSIGPTQWVISQSKYDHCCQQMVASEFSDYPPIPVKQIGDQLFFTDGHTRALVLFNHGIREINVIDDTDDLNWNSYLVCLKWCQDENIACIRDLSGRLVNDNSFKNLWLDKCSDLHDCLQRTPLESLTLDMETEYSLKSSICRMIMEALPEWFGVPSAIDDYSSAVKKYPFITVRLSGTCIGFCALKINYGINADLYVLGLLKEFHGMGIGTRLIQFIEKFCVENNLKYMTVKTLSERHSDKNYAVTRKFYEARGFLPLEEFPDLWDAANPCLYMLKEVTS